MTNDEQATFDEMSKLVQLQKGVIERLTEKVGLQKVVVSHYQAHVRHLRKLQRDSLPQQSKKRWYQL